MGEKDRRKTINKTNIGQGIVKYNRTKKYKG